MTASRFHQGLTFTKDTARTIAGWIYRPPFSSPWLLVAAITFLGAVFRFWGIFHGFQERFIYHPDAGLIFTEAWRVYLSGETQGTYFGMVYLEFLVWFMKGVDHLGLFLGISPAWSYDHIGALGNLLSAGLGTATIPAVYGLGKKAYSRSAGLLGALFLSVNPFHAFHSHYPYRDVPMVFFLTLTLLLCLLIAEHPSWLRVLAAGILSLVTAAVKPAGFLVVLPLLTASVLGLVRLKKWGWLVFMGLVYGTVFLLMQHYKLSFIIDQHGNLFRFILYYFSDLTSDLLFGLQKIFLLLLYWVGYPLGLAFLAGLLYGCWRKRDPDIVLISFLVPAFFISAVYKYLDERFLIFFLPPAVVLLGRLMVALWQQPWKRAGVRVLLGLALSTLLFQASIQSLWQGLLFSLPDTLVLSEKWLAAHLPRNTSLAIQAGYYPRDLNTWPAVQPLDPAQPLSEELRKGKIVVTSSADYLHRWLLFPEKFPKQTQFYQGLPREATLMKSIAFEPRGFVHSTVQIYRTTPPPSPGLRLDLPRPYDCTWNEGISFTEKSPYDRDDRTFFLKGADQQKTLLVSRERLSRIAVFIQNSKQPCRVRVQVGGKVKIRNLKPDEKQVLHFDPWWLLPRTPALYSVRLTVADPEAQILVHLRCGDLEIAETYALWEFWTDALRYLEKYLRGFPEDIDAYLLLATAYERRGRHSEARETLRRMQERFPVLLDRYRLLGDPRTDPPTWSTRFLAFTGLDPSLLSYALSKDLEAEQFYGIGENREKDVDASGDLKITYNPKKDRFDFFVNEGLLVAPGVYTAWFYLQSPEGQNRGPLATIRIFSGEREVASRLVMDKEIKCQKGFKKIAVPFTHPHPWKGIVVNITGTGRGAFSLDKIRIEPDLQKICRQKVATLQALAKE